MLERPKPKENLHIYKVFEFQQSRNIEKTERMEEFNEEDIWGNIDAETSEQVGFKENDCNSVAVCRSMGKEGNYNNSRRSAKIDKKNSIYHEDNSKRKMRYQSSAPVTIPDWSQMSFQDKNENCWSRGPGLVDDDSSDDDGGDCVNMIPPHELIARQLARSEITPFSVYEGIGRTLKSRDAVWTITGFIE